jgi:hypothetical protein
MSGKDLKARLEAFITDRQRELVELENRTVVERARLTGQIEAATGALRQWDSRLESAIDALELAGIRVRTD